MSSRVSDNSTVQRSSQANNELLQQSTPAGGAFQNRNQYFAPPGDRRSEEINLPLRCKELFNRLDQATETVRRMSTEQRTINQENSQPLLVCRRYWRMWFILNVRPHDSQGQYTGPGMALPPFQKSIPKFGTEAPGTLCTKEGAKIFLSSLKLGNLIFPQDRMSVEEFLHAVESRAHREGWTEDEVLGSMGLIDFRLQEFPRPCYNCGVPGHSFVGCENPRQDVCNNCLKIGHTRQNCPLLTIDNRRKSSLDSVNSSEQCNDPRTENERKTHLHLSLVPSSVQFVQGAAMGSTGNQESNEPVILMENELDLGFEVEENDKTHLWSQNTGSWRLVLESRGP
ncbi:hypothetical protein KQX54_009618 [Cotesia glomerata]|uniref:CCHC-type domain-containing protein n=1 Tax=Cotesia glomerata TaxID=32391 RepID=A0AAV7HSR1_COTGL|nr:hypothetical protein KQX54_009618 [Cotesia glomerata]